MIDNQKIQITKLHKVGDRHDVITKEDMRREKLYQTTMHIARKMHRDGMISEAEYHRVDRIFLEKYRPLFGEVFSGIR